MPDADLSLLSLDWHGCGNPIAADGARLIADTLFPAAAFVRAQAAGNGPLAPRAGVLALEQIAARTLTTLEDLRSRAAARLFHVGATCATEFAPVAWLNERYAGDLAVVWLDAHADLNTPASSPSGRFHGMVLRALTGDGPESLVRALARPLQRGQIFLAGARDLDPPEREYDRSAAISVTTMEELGAPGRLVDRLMASGLTRAYVHLDLDVLDPVMFPDVLVPTPGGAAVPAIAAQIRALAVAVDVVGFSVVEFVARSAEGLPTVARLLSDTGVRIGALRTMARRDTA